MARLTDTERAIHMANLPDWTHDAARDAIYRTYLFNDFNQAFGFMTQVAAYAEKNNHHPEWLNIWNKVEVTLTTHDVSGLSSLDTTMAEWMDGVYLSITHSGSD